MKATDLDLAAEYERLCMCLLLLGIRVDGADGLELWRERVRQGRSPFDVRGLTGVQRWATAILEHDDVAAPADAPNRT